MKLPLYSWRVRSRPAPTCGRSAERAMSSDACALATRARAIARLGLPCSAWSIRPLSCASPKASHQRASTSLRCTSLTRTPLALSVPRPSDCASRSLACESMPDMSAQPASTARASAAEIERTLRRKGRSGSARVIFFSFFTGRDGLRVVEDAAQVAFELLPLLAREAGQVVVLHAGEGMRHFLRRCTPFVGELDVHHAP